jgi:hypothetical protein
MPELTRRYIVMTMSAEGPLDLEDADAPFVLKPWKDPAALEALEAYRAHCYPELAAELGQWIAAIRQGPTVRGGVGRRNAEHLASSARRVPARAPRRARRTTGRRPKTSARRARPKRKGRRSR